MMEKLPEYLRLAEMVTQKQNWKEALDASIPLVRSVLVFDNLALYLINEQKHILDEIVFARAVGRGKSAEADAAWGEKVAAQVVGENSMIVQEPKQVDSANRVHFPFVLGLPLRTSFGLVGAVIFIRFGGPAYTPDQVMCAQMVATQFSSLFDRKHLQEQVERMQDASRVVALQEDFIATISHEMRTPLGFIKGYSTTLLRQDIDWDDETRREFLTIIDEEADRLNTLLQNILESARLQSETLPINFQPVRLDALIRDTVIRAQARYRDLKIDIEASACPPVLADSVRLAQVLENLFSNAAKYAPGAPVHVKLTNDALHQQINVYDDGPGIPPEHLPHIFERFYRAQVNSSSGSGLGLFICRKIIEAHGGSIQAESPAGQGAHFTIKLPLAQAGTEAKG